MHTGHSHANAPAYRRRTPEKEPPYQVLAEHLETFLERTRSSDRQLPTHVERELRAFLECGISAHGFLCVRCEDSIRTASSRFRASDAPSVPAAYAGKPVFNAEYDEGYVDDPSDLCNRAESEQIRVLVLPLDLDDTFRITCD